MIKNCFCFVLFAFFNITLSQTISDTLPKTAAIEEVRISTLHINDSLQNAPASISLLSANRLKRNNNSDISLALNVLPGVYMQTANFTTNRISIRGIGARTPYGTNKIRAFYGSIPLTSGDSETTIEDIDIENISQVEIIKGPLSSVYGAGLGGAILISPKVSSNEISASTTHGSYGLLKNSFDFGIDKKSSSLNLNYHNLQSDGWRQNSSYNREGVTLAGELFRKANSKMTYFGNYTWLKAYIPSSIDKKTFDENPKAAAATWLASKGYKEYYSALGGLGYDFNISKNIRNSTAVYVNYKDNYETRPFDILHQYTFAYGARTQFLAHFKLATLPTNVIIGGEYFGDEYHGRNLQNLYKKNNNNGSLKGDLLTANNQKRNFYNAFAQLRISFVKQLELQAGLNVNQTHFNLDNTYPTVLPSQKYDYNPIWSPQVSLLFKLSNLQTIYASASRGFSLPSVSETLTATRTINADIKPESGYNYEVGGKFYFFRKTFYTEIALYRMEIKDLLVAKRIGEDQYVGVNAGETLHQGIELSLNHFWQMNRMFSMSWYASGSFGEYRFEDFVDSGNDFSKNRLTGVPSHKANAGLVFNIKNWYVSGDFLFVDKIPLNDSNSVYANAYKTVNAKTGYRFEIFPKLNSELSFGVNNIGNEHYASLILPNAVAPPTGTPRYYYPGLPINYYANISVKYSL